MAAGFGYSSGINLLGREMFAVFAAVYCRLCSLNKAEGSLHLAREKHASVFSLVAPLYGQQQALVKYLWKGFYFVLQLPYALELFGSPPVS